MCTIVLGIEFHTLNCRQLRVELLLHSGLGHVGRKIDLVRQGLDLDGKALLHRGEDLIVIDLSARVLGLRNEADGHTTVSETSCTPYPMHVRVGLHWEVVVEHDVDPLNIETTGTKVGRDQDTRFKLLELVVLRNTASRIKEFGVS